MKKSYILFSLFLIFQSFSQTPITSGPNWSVSNLTPNNSFNFSTEILYGPDNFLWLTERQGKKVVRVNKTTGAISTMIDLSAQVFQNAGQDGLLGMAVHPDLYANVATTTNNYVYIVYTYDSGGRKLRISRFTFNNTTKTLGSELTLLQGIPASNDHNSGRIIIGPDTKLYYTCGDQGANQFANACNTVRSQILPTNTTDYQNYHGKMLRINLDGSIPSDNPTLAGVKSHVYSYGHRNPQGIVFTQDGSLFSSEHGAKVDDELNKIVAGKNYGWPLIAGYYDNLAYTYCNWSSAAVCNSGDFSDNGCAVGVTPLTEFNSYPSAPPADFVPPISTYNSTTSVVPTGGFLTWPTVAPASIDIYELNKIPNWGRSLLIPTLKKGTIYRAKLAPDGNSVVNDAFEIFHASNDRYRDVALDPDGITIYAITDNSGATSGPAGSSAVTIANPGVIVKIQYTGAQVNSIPTAICQSANLELDAFDKLTLLPSNINNGSFDSDGTIASLSAYKTQFNCSHIGTPQTVYLTVVDNQGGESTCQTTLNVLQTTQPLTAPTLPTVNATCQTTVTPTSISHKCNTIVPTTVSVTTFTEPGTYTIVWNYNLGANTVVSNQSVIISNPSIPTGLTSNSITTSSANVTWNPIVGPDIEVRYKTNASSIWTNFVTVNTNFVELPNLLPNTTYNVQIRSVCLNSESTFTASHNFTTANPSYCTSLGSFVTSIIFTDTNQFITNIKLAKTSTPTTYLINQNSTGSRYTNYTTPNPDVEIGTPYTVVITKNDTDDWRNFGFRAYIDTNRDGDFSDSGENITGTTNGDNLFNDTSPVSARTFTLTLPQNAIIGSTKMRVVIHQWWTPSDACGTFTFDGTNHRPLEYEDYSINLIAPCGNVSTTWNGTTWSNGIPNANVTAIFTGNFNSNRSIEACSVQVNGSAQVTFNPNNTLTVTNGISVATTAGLILENKASLVQINNTANIGNITIKRTSTPFKRLDYTAWSSPVIGQQLQSFSPNTLSNRFYEYNFSGSTTTTAYVAATVTNNFANAKGYMIRAANNWPTTATSYNGQWTGVAKNGNYTQTIGLTYNLLGNPYPSPVNATRFLATNTIVSTLYFWTHHVPQNGGYVAKSNYASFNNSGGTAATAGGVVPNGNIQIGQGFFVRATTAGTVTFNNTHREKATMSNQFFKSNESISDLETEKNRIWLNLTDNNNSYNQILIGYLNDATDNYDLGYDGEVFNEEESFIYSKLNNDKLAIQAKAIPFLEDDFVPLGIKLNQSGEYKISIEKTEGLFVSQNVFIKDNYTNTYHNIKNSPYSFASNSGDFNNRFQMVYKNDSNTSEFTQNVTIFTTDNRINVISNDKIAEIEVFDVLGRKLFDYENISSKLFEINNINNSNQALFFKIKFENGKEIFKKYIQ